MAAGLVQPTRIDAQDDIRYGPINSRYAQDQRNYDSKISSASVPPHRPMTPHPGLPPRSSGRSAHLLVRFLPPLRPLGISVACRPYPTSK
ncbi:cytochrome b5, partial [Lasius niger]